MRKNLEEVSIIMQLALRSETRQRSGIKTDLEESTCGMSFLYALIKHPSRFSSRLDNFPFFPFLEMESPLLEFEGIVSEESYDAAWAGNRVEDTEMRRGTSSISEAYVQSTFCACMHGGTK